MWDEIRIEAEGYRIYIKTNTKNIWIIDFLFILNRHRKTKQNKKQNKINEKKEGKEYRIIKKY
jgi:hypothetical protein